MNPQYIYTKGPYREFRGYVFCNGKPTTILDRGALEEIAKDDSFKLYTEPLIQETLVDKCPKCGKTGKQGMAVHIRYCKA